MVKVVYVLLTIVFFGIGMSLQWNDFSRALTYKKAFFYASACQYIVFPGICFILCAILQIPPNISLGILIVTFCPSATSSNLYAFMFKGDTAFSITLSSVSIVLTPFTLPFFINWSAIYFYGEGKVVQLPLLETIVTTLGLFAIPMFAGMAFRRLNLMFARWARRPFEILSGLIITFIILGFTVKFGHLLRDLALSFSFSFLLLCISIYLGIFGRQMLGLSERMARTISFEICLQNGATATVIGITTLGMPELASGLGPYCLLMFFMAYVWGYYLKKKVPLSKFQSSVAVGKSANPA